MEDLAHAYKMQPGYFDEDPVEVFKRNIWVHPFHEENPKRLVEAVGSEKVVFGSDFPHAEGLSDPVSFVSELEAAGLSAPDVKNIMGNTMNRLMGYPEAA